MLNRSLHHEQLQQSSKRIRRLGWVLLSCGIFLVGFMAYLMVLIAGIMRRSDNPRATTRFTGDSSDAAMIFAILGLVLLFGAGCVAAGAWQIRYGTRNLKLVRVVLVLGAIFYVIGILAQLME